MATDGTPVKIIGLSAHYHDSACCLMIDGELILAAEEERFTRHKHESGFPAHAFRFCLEDADLTIGDIDRLAFYEDPVKKLTRQVWMGLRPGASPELKRRVFHRLSRTNRLSQELKAFGYRGPVEYVDHHLSHAASSFYFSGFREAAILTVDGIGEWATTAYWRGNDQGIELLEQIDFPHSIGLLYSTITAYLGFEANSGEYKVMGLAPYGQPRFVREMRTLIEPQADGGYRLNLDYFDFLVRDRMYSDALVDLFGQPPREPESPLLQCHSDIARSLQVVLEETLLAKVRYLHTRVSSDNLCMAGGVALNCVANGRILTDGPYSKLFVQPAASDAGGALGAAAVAHHRATGERPHGERLTAAYLGPRFSVDQIRRLLAPTALAWQDFSDDASGLLDAVVDRLIDGQVIGWFVGRMEFGPRALGARSILADPRHPKMRERINALVKKREGFRPFAPAVLAEAAADHFEMDHDSPFMLETFQVKSKLALPAITHVDGSARVQTVRAEDHPCFAALLDTFHRRTGCPMLLNTSFNVRGEPIVCAPLDAIICFVRARLDCLVLEDLVIDRDAIPGLWLQVVEQLPLAGRSVDKNVYTML
jgi:carbamoyltransferase